MKIKGFVGLLAGLTILSNNLFAQPQEVHYQPVPPRTVNTNGATFLPDHSQIPLPPGGTPQQNSPGTTTDFQGLTDNNTFYPPDTHGAVGTNHVVTILNSQVRILTRSGTIITTMLL